MLPAATPNVTQAQIVALLQQIIAPIVAFGVIDNKTAAVVITAASAVVTISLILGDAIIRHGRANAVAHVASLDLAQLAAAGGPAAVNNTAKAASGPAPLAPQPDVPPPGTPIEAAPPAGE